MPKKINVDDIKWVLVKEHPTFKVGMSADATLRIAKLSHRVPLAKPKEAGKDANGKIVIWYYQDAKLTMKHFDKMYRVSKIEVPERFVKK